MFFKKKLGRRFIDMHCHILPGVDDGAQTMDEALEMLKIAEKNGITDIILTPHYKEGRKNAGRDSIRKRVKDLQKKAKSEGININLYPGNEVFYFSDIEKKMDEGDILTLNSTDRMLIEFSPDARFTYMKNAVEKIISLGYTPVLAHVERYSRLVDDFERVIELKDFGAEIQINSNSVIGKYGNTIKKFVHLLISEQVIDYIGTDAHNTGKRAPEVKKCCELLYKKYDREYVDAILFGNAECILNPEE